MKTKEWKKELYKHFADNDQVSAFEIFVDVLLSARTEEVIKMVEGRKRNNFPHIIDHDDKDSWAIPMVHEEGYNSALDDILTTLRSSGGEKKEE